jgi:toxin ParE1/3/4
MTAKQVVLRGCAAQDIEQAVDYYVREAGEAVAAGFVDRLEACLQAIGGQPAIGSLRYAHELDVPGVRAFPLQRYPYLLFYVEQDDRIDVWRVLHAQTDIPAWLTSG